jgi:two-component system sensor histidine kinase UhpB
VAERVRPPRLESRGLASALHETAIRCGLPVDLTIDPSVAAELPAPHVIELYRIAQEAIGNAVRHARPSQIEMHLDRAGDALRLTIADDGTGFDATHATLEDQRGLGLAGMRERAALIGARLEILSAPGSGTRIVLLVPLPARAIATVALDPLPHRETRP